MVFAPNVRALYSLVEVNNLSLHLCQADGYGYLKTRFVWEPHPFCMPFFVNNLISFSFSYVGSAFVCILKSKKLLFFISYRVVELRPVFFRRHLVKKETRI